MAKAPPTIAATSTLAMLRAAERRGVPTADLLHDAGFSLDFLEGPDARLPGTTALALWHALRERTGDPALQLTAPACLPFGAYRIIDYLVASSATVGEGVNRFVRFFGLITESIRLDVVEGESALALRLLMADGRAVPPVLVDYTFAALVTRIRMRMQPALQVQGVELRQAEPVDAVPYRDVFGAPVQFGAAEDRLWFSADEWHAPTHTADAALVRMLDDHARILARQIPVAPGFEADVRRTIAAVLPARGTAAQVARELNMSVRTLQRRMIAAGTSFREESDLVRQRLAEGYLADRKVSIVEVAFLLGFSDQSSFTRAFRAWTGEAPGRWRQRRA